MFSGKLVVSVYLALGLCSAVAATELVWQGDEGADFCTAANWSPAQTPTAADTVVFNASATPSLNVADVSVGNITIMDGTVEITGSKILRFGPSDGTGTINVASGASMKLSATLYGNASGGSTIAKSGAGTLTLNKGVSYYVTEVEVSAGTLELASGAGGDGFNPAGKLLTVRSGATFKTLEMNRIANGVRIHLDAGATYDMNGKRDAIGAVTGAGSVINGADLYCTLYNGPHLFSGTTTANVYLYEADKNFPPVEDESVLIIGSANAFANAKLTPGNIVPSSPEKSALRFAPGIGTFHIKMFVPSTTQPLHLEDTEGKPVTVALAFVTTGGTCTGAGSLIVNGGNNGVFYTNQLQNTGFLGASNCTATIGDNTLAHEPDLSTLSSLNPYQGGTVRLALAQPTTLTTPFTGLGGTYELKSCPDLTLTAFSPTNCTLSTSGVCSNLTITGGAAKDTSLNLAAMSPESALTISGGETDGLAIMPNQSLFTASFTGGTHTNVTLSGYPAVNAIGRYHFTGGNWTLGNDFAIIGSHVFEVTGGRLAFEKGVKFGGGSSTNEFMIVATGGEIDIGPSPKKTYPRGLGMDLSGTARVMLPESGETLRVSSDNVSHTIRLRDDAYLCIRSNINLSTSDTQHDTTGRVEVAGGTLHMCAQFNRGTSSTGLGSYMEVILNGGQLFLDARGANANRTLFQVVNAAGMTMRLGAETSEINVIGDRFSNGYNINLPLMTDVPDGIDGGFVKTGPGTLRLERPVTATGDIVVRAGTLATLSTETATPFGSGTLYNLGCKVAFEAAGDYRTGPVVSSGSAAFDFYHTGSACATVAFASLAAESGAVLVLNDSTATVFDGTTVRATVEGGLATDATTGLVKLPIVLRYRPTGATRYDLSHARYDATNGLVSPTYVTTFATDGSGVTDVRTAAVTLNDDRHVGALRVKSFSNASPLTIATGKTLMVGNGTEPAIVLLVNPENTSYTKPLIAGGTLSFGTSRGYLLSNIRLVDTLPSEVTSVIAGSGGLTIGGGMQDGGVMIRLSGANTYSGGTLVDNAHVEVTKATGLGTGTVDVMDGGALKVSADGSLANALKLAGTGSFVDNWTRSGYALFADANVSVSGATTVDTMIGATVGTAFGRTLTFAGGVSGGVLTVFGEGTVSLPTANAGLAGLVITSGTVSVTQAASLGAGDVELAADGTLRFDNTAEQIVPNRIVGSGTIVLAGRAAVTFADRTGFTGRIETASGAAVDLAGSDLEVPGLNKNGSVINSGVAASLTVNGALDLQYNGSIAGDVALVKKGAGRQAFVGDLTYAGATTVAGGTLVLGALTPPETLPVADGKLFRLDASAASTVDATKDAAGGVTTWSDADGGAYIFSNKTTATTWPVYRTEAKMQVNGKNTVYFPGLKEKLISEKSASLRTIALVMRPEASQLTSSATKNWMCAGIFGLTDQDNGVRFNSIASGNDPITSWPISNSLWGGLYTDVYVNGVKTYAITHGVASLVWFDAGETISSTSWALGCYSTLNRPYFGDFCEVVAYDRVLSEVEREAVSDYLMVKWGVAAQPTWEKRFDVLPTTTDLTVEEGATIDLNGTTQTLGSFDIAGTLANTVDETAVLKVLTGTCYLRETATISSNVVLDFESGNAVLDLGGKTWTVYRFRGASTQVRNGTLVELHPERGMVILFR